MTLLTKLKDAWQHLFKHSDNGSGHKHRSFTQFDPRLLDDLGLTPEQAEELDKRAARCEPGRHNDDNC